MPWARIDDQLHAHPKIASLWRSSPAALGLHLMAISYAAAYTDGEVPDWWIEERAHRHPGIADALVDAGVWDRDGDRIVIHDWEIYNPTKAQVAEDRAAGAERQRKSRERRKKAAEEAAARA